VVFHVEIRARDARPSLDSGEGEGSTVVRGSIQTIVWIRTRAPSRMIGKERDVARLDASRASATSWSKRGRPKRCRDRHVDSSLGPSAGMDGSDFESKKGVWKTIIRTLPGRFGGWLQFSRPTGSVANTASEVFTFFGSRSSHLETTCVWGMRNDRSLWSVCIQTRWGLCRAIDSDSMR
jgi:hypothetical protein